MKGKFCFNKACQNSKSWTVSTERETSKSSRTNSQTTKKTKRAINSTMRTRRGMKTKTMRSKNNNHSPRRRDDFSLCFTSLSLFLDFSLLYWLQVGGVAGGWELIKFLNALSMFVLMHYRLCYFIRET